MGARDNSQIKGAAFFLKSIISDCFKLVTSEMKGRGIGRTERPENKTQVLQDESCGGQAPISTSLWCVRLQVRGWKGVN